MPLPVCSYETYKKNHPYISLQDFREEREKVLEIINTVRQEGDAALIDYTREFDRAKIGCLRVTEEEFVQAAKSVDPALSDALKIVRGNIEKVHQRQVQSDWWLSGEGTLSGQRFVPLNSMGAYIPGGTAAYPSSVLMTVVPARIAGVKDIYICTPPGEDGMINNLTLAAAREAGVTAVFKVGGAQAVAAMAYGTQSIPAVDKIVGPGNIYVTLAKKEVFGQVGIDMLAGPSEIVIVADENARADFIAADMLSQAEHDELSRAILITTSEKLANLVRKSLEEQLSTLPRKEIAEKSLNEQGAVILVSDLEKAWPVVNEIAPEHLELHLEDAWSYLSRITSAGSIFLGSSTPEPLGDYWAGSNHVLPTSSTARYASALGVADFVKRSYILAYNKHALERSAPQVALLARSEGLEAHARSVLIRRSSDGAQDKGRKKDS